MMISNNLNWYDHGGYTEMTAPYSKVNVTNEGESKRSIVNETLSQNCSAKENGLFFMKEDKPEYANEKQKEAKNEVACDVTNYFNVSNVFECGRNNTDVSCERACMATEDNEYFTDILDTLNEYQDRHSQRLSSMKLREAVRRVMDEEEEEMERNINNITCHTSFQSPVTKSVQKKDTSWSLERRLAAGVLAEMLENFKGCSIQSDKQVDEIFDSKEQFEARNWLRNDFAEQINMLNDSRFFLWMEVIQRAIQVYLLTLPTEFQLRTLSTEF